MPCWRGFVEGWRTTVTFILAENSRTTREPVHCPRCDIKLSAHHIFDDVISAKSDFADTSSEKRRQNSPSFLAKRLGRENNNTLFTSNKQTDVDTMDLRTRIASSCPAGDFR